ncbi:nSTAND1 domain-containing NTPase [Solimonas marina]|uniref:Novel STAND NTPase 1 domain-containing protein n=1 Tax=Solimonas marina TaxID=2714601 RepID=A0A969WD54_9GAMM|nr:hypothetical protein [Solimonas marina]NKF23823.1 hypothetical protein [Solimonas marina]
MLVPGGISDKLGNQYEAKWAVRQLLDVAAGQADGMRYEGIEAAFKGFEFAIYKGLGTEWHQCKMHSARGNWTLNALQAEGVLDAFKQRLLESASNTTIFVSEDPARALSDLAEKARRAESELQFEASLTLPQRDGFKALKGHWSIDTAQAWQALQRCFVRTLPEAEIDTSIDVHVQLVLDGTPDHAYPALRQFLEQRFNQHLTTDSLRAELPAANIGTIRDWALRETMSASLRRGTEQYLGSYAPFGVRGSALPRTQVDEILASLRNDKGHQFVLITGVAGSGKSGVVRALTSALTEEQIPHLALRIDHYLDQASPRELGHAIFDRRQSPVVMLKELAPRSPSVLIIDQLDAVSEVSGRHGAVRATVLAMLGEARALTSVKVVLVCRIFDVEADSTFKQLESEERVLSVSIPALDWPSVAPVVSEVTDVTKLSENQKNLLCLPINLVTYLEVASEGTDFHSRNDLFRALMNKKDRAIRARHGGSWSTFAALHEVAAWMSERQKLDAPERILDAYTGARDVLSSEGLLAHHRQRLSFFHESFFDYIYSRGFVARSESLHAMLVASRQTLFRRTQVRQILEALRQDDPERYEQELDRVLSAPEIRMHIKTSIAQWLSTLPNPQPCELDIVLRFDAPTGKVPPLVRLAILSSASWFPVIHARGGLAKALASPDEERQQAILWALHSAASEYPDAVAALLRDWWKGDGRKARQLLDWFSTARARFDGTALKQLCEDVIRTNAAELFDTSRVSRRDFDIAEWAESHEDGGSSVVRALFDAWFVLHPDQHPFGREDIRFFELEGFVKRATSKPMLFFTAVEDALARSILIIKAAHTRGERDWTFDSRILSSASRADALLHAFVLALGHVAGTDPQRAARTLDKFAPTDHAVCKLLHLAAITANAQFFSHRLPEFLCYDDIADVGFDGIEWKPLADAIAAALNWLSPEDRETVETFCLTLDPELTRAAREAADLAHRSEGNREYVLHMLSRSGATRRWILETIGDGQLSDRCRDELGILRRKFANERKPPEAKRISAGWVRSPIPVDRAKHMSDRQWLNAIRTYTTDERFRDRDDPLKGGARELATMLQSLAKDNPARFAKLVERIPYDANRAYVRDLLHGLAASASPPTDLLVAALRAAHQWPDRPFGDAIARVVSAHPETASEQNIFDAVVWYARHGDARDESENEDALLRREVLTIGDLISHGGGLRIRGINGARGAALEAAAAVLWHSPLHVDAIWALLDDVIVNERLASVRCCAVAILLPLYNIDLTRCSRAFDRLIHSTDGSDAKRYAIATTLNGVELMRYLLANAPAVADPLLERMLQSEWQPARLIASWMMFGRGFFDARYEAAADAWMEEGLDYRKLACQVAVDVFEEAQFVDRAQQQLIRFFRDDEKEIRHLAARVFTKFSGADLHRHAMMVNAFLESNAYTEGSHEFHRALETASCDVSELVIMATERALAKFHAGPQAYRDFHDLQELLNREYAATEGRGDLRERLLDIIDRMLELNVYGVDEITKQHERH